MDEIWIVRQVARLLGRFVDVGVRVDESLMNDEHRLRVFYGGEEYEITVSKIKQTHAQCRVGQARRGCRAKASARRA